MHTGFWRGPLKEREHLENLGVDMRILKWALKKYSWRAWTDYPFKDET